MNEDY